MAPDSSSSGNPAYRLSSPPSLYGRALHLVFRDRRIPFYCPTRRVRGTYEAAETQLGVQRSRVQSHCRTPPMTDDVSDTLSQPQAAGLEAGNVGPGIASTPDLTPTYCGSLGVLPIESPTRSAPPQATLARSSAFLALVLNPVNSDRPSDNNPLTSPLVEAPADVSTVLKRKGAVSNVVDPAEVSQANANDRGFVLTSTTGSAAASNPLTPVGCASDAALVGDSDVELDEIDERPRKRRRLDAGLNE